MMNKIQAIVKQPAFWVLAIVIVLATTAFSALRKPFVKIAGKVPGNDVVDAL